PCLFLMQPFATAQAACSCDWICIAPAIGDGAGDLLATNMSSVPVTFSIQFNTRKYRVDGPAQITRTLAAGQALVLPVKDRGDGQAIDSLARSGRPFNCQWTIGNMDAAHDEELVYMLPYESGRSYRVLQGFGSRFSHTGTEQYAVDFKMSEGTPVHAARGGVVARIEESFSRGCWSDECAGEANYIVILHDDETTGEYYHLQRGGVLVEAGDRISAGQLIGLSGNTGHSALPHLHFGVYRAIERGKEQSIPFRFLSADGIVDQPRRGGMYVAIQPGDSDRQTAAGQPSTTGY
ncbi:MAG TPA: M23 family metallopeptidase, partial [Woeseiaceae bacterium]|nr:M23 family metallopeptidase [Woeseiaceae bacterium]